MSSALIEQVWDNSSHRHFEHCEFKVATRSKWMHGPISGLFVAIRELRFRKDVIGECIDYVIFETHGVTTTSHKICGTILADETAHNSKYYFEIPEGSIKIIVHIDDDDLKENVVDMKLTVTAFEGLNYITFCSLFTFN